MPAATKCSKYKNRNTRKVNPPPTITSGINDTSMSLWQCKHLACFGSSEVRIFPYSQFGQDLSFRNMLQAIPILHVAFIRRNLHGPFQGQRYSPISSRERKIGNSFRNCMSISSLTWRGAGAARISRFFAMARSSGSGLPRSSHSVGLARSLKSG